MDTVSEFHAEAPQAIASEGLAQGPYVAARVGFKPTTLRSKDIASINVPSRITHIFIHPPIHLLFYQAIHSFFQPPIR